MGRWNMGYWLVGLQPCIYGLSAGSFADAVEMRGICCDILGTAIVVRDIGDFESSQFRRDVIDITDALTGRQSEIIVRR